MLPKSPCLDCKDRRNGCHSECERGQEYTKALRIRNEEIRQAKSKDRDIDNFKYQQVMKMKEAGR